MNKAFLIAGGEMDVSFLKAHLKTADTSDIIVAIDSGLHYLDTLGICPDMIVGDLDSVDHGIVKGYMENKAIRLIRYNPVKDATDTELAIHLAIEEGCRSIDILGAFGGRLDHMLSNLYLCGISKTVSIALLNPHNKIYAMHRKPEGHRIERANRWGTYISFFPLFGPIIGLCLKGMKYPLQNKNVDIKTEASLTTSNEIVEEFATIYFQNDSILVVESKDEMRR